MKTCNYKFPCHPQDMVDNTPDTVTATSRMLRIQIINMIVELSQKYKQNKIDKNYLLILMIITELSDLIYQKY